MDRGATAALNEEAVRAWDTVLYERWKLHRAIFVEGATAFSERALATDPPAAGLTDVSAPGFGQ